MGGFQPDQFLRMITHDAGQLLMMERKVLGWGGDQGATLNPHFCFSIYFTNCVTCEECALLSERDALVISVDTGQESRMDGVVNGFTGGTKRS